jgi:hypothetical protein
MIGHDVTHKADETMSLLRRTNELLLGFPAVRRQSLHLRLKDAQETLRMHPELEKNPFSNLDTEVKRLVKMLDETSTPEEKQPWWNE